MVQIGHGSNQILNGEAIRLAMEFSATLDMERLKGIAILLSKPGATVKAAQLPEFLNSISRLAAVARDGEQTERLKALAILFRLKKQAKKLEKQVIAELAKPSLPLTAPTSELSDASDRDYLAQALEYVQFPGKVEYLAEFISSEGHGKTDARFRATLALLRATRSLTEVFSTLGIAHAKLLHDTQDPSTSRARNLVRTLQALVEALRHVEAAADRSTSAALVRFVVSSLGTPISDDRKTRIEIAKGSFELLLSFAKSNFALARHSETFDIVRFCHKLFAPASWPRELERPLIALGRLLRETITFLAEAGRTDTRLRELLVLTSGDLQARATLKEIAQETAGISNDVRHWLETGKAPVQMMQSAAVAETMLEAVDHDLAIIFRSARQLRNTKHAIQDEVSEVLAQSRPELKSATQSVFRRIDEIADRAETLAAVRQMSENFAVNDVLEYAPQDHEADVPVLGIRYVQVVEPQVIRKIANRAPRVVLKARVAPLEGEHDET